MAEMKNICGKIPMDLHEKVREEIELTESSTQKFLQQVIEEHFNKLEGKGEISMGAVRTVAVQVSEELFQRLKVVIGKKHMKQKDFLIQIIEEALEKVEVEWQSKDQPEESEQTTGELGTEETQPEERTEPEEENEPEGESEPEEESEPDGESEPEGESKPKEESEPEEEAEPKEENEPEGESEPKEENEPEGESETEEETEPEGKIDLEEETKAEEPTEW